MIETKSETNGLHATDQTEIARYAGLTRVGVHLTGCAPLLMNAMSEEALLKIRDPNGKGPKTQAKPTIRDEAANKVYLLADGRPHIPVKNIYAAFIDAGKFVRMDGKRQVSTSDSTNLPGMLLIEDSYTPLTIPGKKQPATWEVDIQQGRNPNGGQAVCVIRPRFDAWEVRLVIQVDQQVMPLAMARQLVDKAGRQIGLCDFRPTCKGTFGRFDVTQWAVIDSE